MDEFINKNKGPLIAMGSAAVGLILLIVISALANLPQASETDTGPINIWESIFFLVLTALLIIGVILFVRKGLLNPDNRFEEEQDLITLANTGNQFAQQIEKLFGTTDINQITTGIQAMYAELEELRADQKDQKEQEVEDLTPKVKEQERIIAALTSERDQAQAAHEKWEAKAIGSTKEITKLREELKQNGKWQPVPDSDLTAFFPTVTLSDSDKEKPFLSSKRRQRRLIQRLTAEGYSIVQKVSYPRRN